MKEYIKKIFETYINWLIMLSIVLFEYFYKSLGSAIYYIFFFVALNGIFLNGRQIYNNWEHIWQSFRQKDWKYFNKEFVFKTANFLMAIVFIQFFSNSKWGSAIYVLFLLLLVLSIILEIVEVKIKRYFIVRRDRRLK